MIGVAAPQAETMYWETPMPMAPVKRTGRRPKRSMAQRPGKVITTFTELTITWRMKELGRPLTFSAK